MNTREKVPFLANKTVLFIGTGFYNYDEAICKKLKELGADTSYFCSIIKTSTSRFLKLVGLKKFADKNLQKKRASKIGKLKTNSDFVFIIKGEDLLQSDIDLIKRNNPSAKFILYFWDDFRRISNKKTLLNNITNIWSFDTEDCEKYGFKFRPLFYFDGLKPSEKNIYLSSIGGWHSNRIDLFREVSQILKKQNKNYYLKLYLSKRIKFIDRYLKHSLTNSDEELIITKPLGYKKLSEIMSRSKCILDITHVSQRGLSIRTLEALKCGCHLITTNMSISSYNDISPEYYTIIKNEKPINFSILNKNEFPISNLGEKYSLYEFLYELFSL